MDVDAYTNGYRAGRRSLQTMTYDGDDRDGLTPEEFMAEAERRGLNRPRVPPAPQNEEQRALEIRRDAEECVIHAMQLRYGIPIRGGRPHPLAGTLAEMPIQKWQNFCRTAGADFVQTLADAYSVVQGSWIDPVSVADVLGTVVVEDFKAIPICEIDLETPVLLPDDGEMFFTKAAERAVTTALNSYAINVKISRQLLVNDDRGIIDALIQRAAQLLRRVDAQLVGALCNSPPPMPDSQSWFISSNSYTNSGAHTVAGLSAAIDKLSSQASLLGSPSCCLPYAVMVPPALAGIYAQEITQVAAGLPLKLVINPFLTSSSTAYLFANPAQNPAISKLQFRNGGKPNLFRGQTDYRDRVTGEEKSFLGIVIRVEYSTAIAATSRIGIVKLATS